MTIHPAFINAVNFIGSPVPDALVKID